MREPRLLCVPGGKAVINFRPRPAAVVGEVGGEVRAGPTAGKRSVKLGMMGEFEGGELGQETEGWGKGLQGGVSSEGVWSKKGPSNAFAGDGERLPGIGVRRVSFMGGCFPVAWSASRICKET